MTNKLRFDSEFEIRSKYYHLHLSCFYLNLKSSRCCFLKSVSCSVFLYVGLYCLEKLTDGLEINCTYLKAENVYI